jgi:hypothetical protein
MAPADNRSIEQRALIHEDQYNAQVADQFTKGQKKGSLTEPEIDAIKNNLLAAQKELEYGDTISAFDELNAASSNLFKISLKHEKHDVQQINKDFRPLLNWIDLARIELMINTISQRLLLI